MNMSPLDRVPSLRPSGADLASMAVVKVNQAAPVDKVTPSEPTPSVVNLVNMANKPSSGEGVYTSVSDPTKRGSEAATTPKDWTIHRPAPEKVEDPPPEPLYKMLIDHVKSMWIASGSAIQVHQVKNQVDASQHNLNAPPGVLSTEVLTYSPSKINKTEKT
ncbi:MAG: hypothetical protein V4713_05550 [Pseudomonadota bacterium]